ncbi:MAG: hypothetical protein ACRDTF_06455 [Pseudonocardiaceae bacterium]
MTARLLQREHQSYPGGSAVGVGGLSGRRLREQGVPERILRGQLAGAGTSAHLGRSRDEPDLAVNHPRTKRRTPHYW